MRINNLRIYLLSFFFLVVLLPTLAFTVWQVANPQERQEIRKRAATPSGTATLSFEPASESIFATQRLPVDIEIQTPTTPDNQGITGIKAVFSYDNAGALSLTETDIATPLPSPWNYVHKEITTVGNTTTVVIEAIYLQEGEFGYLGAVVSPQTFVTLDFLAQDSGQTTTVSNFGFDTVRSVVMSKSGNQDILSSDLAGASYTVYVDDFPPETTITSGPDAPLRVSEAIFTFTGDDNPPAGTPTEDLVYSYRLDSGSWSAYSSNTTATLTNFSAGQHTFWVRARDIIGNVDPTPASWNFSYEPKTNLNLKLMFDNLPAVCGVNCQNYDKPVRVTVRNASYNPGPLQGTAVFDPANDNYTVALQLPDNFPTGTNNYQVLVKGRSYLQKTLGNTYITKDADNFLDRANSSYKLIVGDITDDNYIMLNDITAVISVWVATEVIVTPGTEAEKYDLDENGKITLSDITAIISNWTTSEVPGDQ